MGRGGFTRQSHQGRIQRKEVSSIRKKFLKHLIKSEERRSRREKRNFDRDLYKEVFYMSGIDEREIEELRQKGRDEV